MKTLFLSATHGPELLIGFGLGVYLFPILTAPPSPHRALLADMAQKAEFRDELTHELRGRDFLHWGGGWWDFPTHPSQEGGIRRVMLIGKGEGPSLRNLPCG